MCGGQGLNLQFECPPGSALLLTHDKAAPAVRSRTSRYCLPGRPGFASKVTSTNFATATHKTLAQIIQFVVIEQAHAIELMSAKLAALLLSQSSHFHQLIALAQSAQEILFFCA